MVLHERGVNAQVTWLKIAPAIAGSEGELNKSMRQEQGRRVKHFMRDPLQRH